MDQSGRNNFVIVNVHFEPERTLRHLRDRLHSIHPHWPAHPYCVGTILGDFNICDPEEERFDVWKQTFTDGDPRKTVVFHSFHTSLRMLSPMTRGGTPQPLGVIRTLSRTYRNLINQPMAEARNSHSHSHDFQNLEIGPYRVITQQYVSSFRSQQIDDTRANVFPAGCRNSPFSVLFCSSFTTTAGSLMIHFWVLAEFSLLLHQVRKMRIFF